MGFEQQLARMLSNASGLAWKRTKAGDVQPRGDVECVSRLISDPWMRMFVEAKAHSSLNPWHILEPTSQVKDWWAKACDEAHAAGLLPCLFMRIKGRGVVVAIPYSLDVLLAKVTRADLGRRWIVEAHPLAWSYSEAVRIVDAAHLLPALPAEQRVVQIADEVLG